MNIQDARILIVDDEPKNVKIASMLLKSEGYTHIDGLFDSLLVLPWIQEHLPDLVLLDIMMPNKDGLELLYELRQVKGYDEVPVIILTSMDDRDIRKRAFDLGAQDFVTKPFDTFELFARVKNILQAKMYNNQLKLSNQNLQEKVEQSSEKLVHSYMQMIHRLGRAAEYKDNDTGNHVWRVSAYSAILAEEIGLSDEEVGLILHTSPMHDIGKIGIPDGILLKPGALTGEEMRIMQKHTIIGADIFSILVDDPEDIKVPCKVDMNFLSTQDVPLLHKAAIISLTHHERWDGSGYPQGLKGEKIPIEGRIVAVADVFDALGSKRPYKEAYPLDKCLDIMHKSSGSHFDPMIVEALFSSLDDIIEIQKRYAEFSESQSPDESVVENELK